MAVSWAYPLVYRRAPWAGEQTLGIRSVWLGEQTKPNLLGAVVQLPHCFIVGRPVVRNRQQESLIKCFTSHHCPRMIEIKHHKIYVLTLVSSKEFGFYDNEASFLLEASWQCKKYAFPHIASWRWMKLLNWTASNISKEEEMNSVCHEILKNAGLSLWLCISLLSHICSTKVW